MTRQDLNAPDRRRKGDLVRSNEIERVLAVLRSSGVAIGTIEVRRDGVIVHPADTKPGNEFDRWVAQDKNRDRATHRQ